MVACRVFYSAHLSVTAHTNVRIEMRSMFHRLLAAASVEQTSVFVQMFKSSQNAAPNLPCHRVSRSEAVTGELRWE